MRVPQRSLRPRACARPRGLARQHVMVFCLTFTASLARMLNAERGRAVADIGVVEPIAAVGSAPKCRKMRHSRVAKSGHGSHGGDLPFTVIE